MGGLSGLGVGWEGLQGSDGVSRAGRALGPPSLPSQVIIERGAEIGGLGPGPGGEELSWAFPWGRIEGWPAGDSGSRGSLPIWRGKRLLSAMHTEKTSSPSPCLPQTPSCQH